MFTKVSHSLFCINTTLKRSNLAYFNTIFREFSSKNELTQRTASRGNYHVFPVKSISQLEEVIFKQGLSLSPSELLELCQCGVSLSSNSSIEQLFSFADLWIPYLTIDELNELLKVVVSSGVREFKPGDTDIPVMIADLLTRRMSELPSKLIQDAASSLSKLGVCHSDFFMASSKKISSILEKKKPETINLNSAVPFLNASSRVHLFDTESIEVILETLNKHAIPTSKSIVRLSQLSHFISKANLELSNDAYEAILNRLLNNFPDFILNESLTAASRGALAVSLCQIINGLCLRTISEEDHSEKALRVQSLKDELLITVLEYVESDEGNDIIKRSKTPEFAAEQLKIAEIVLRFERPHVHARLKRSTIDFIKGLESSATLSELKPQSSVQHKQVSDALKDLLVVHDSEVRVAEGVFIADIAFIVGKPDEQYPEGGRSNHFLNSGEKCAIIEIDGPMHFINGTSRYHAKSIVKHRILSKLGWKVFHIAYNDWPTRRENRVEAIKQLLRTPPIPARDLAVYKPQFNHLLSTENLLT